MKSIAYLEYLTGIERNLTNIEYKGIGYYWNALKTRVDKYNALSLAYGSIVEIGKRGMRYADVISTLRTLHIQKNSAYNGVHQDPWNNFRRCHTDFGIDTVSGILARMCDKVSRFENLRDDPGIDPSGETIADTLLDLASYSVILACLLDERSINPIEGKQVAHG